MLGDQAIHNRAACGERRERAVLVGAHQSAVLGDIGGKNRRQPPFGAFGHAPVLQATSGPNSTRLSPPRLILACNLLGVRRFNRKTIASTRDWLIFAEASSVLVKSARPGIFGTCLLFQKKDLSRRIQGGPVEQ